MVRRFVGLDPPCRERGWTRPAEGAVAHSPTGPQVRRAGRARLARPRARVPDRCRPHGVERLWMGADPQGPTRPAGMPDTLRRPSRRQNALSTGRPHRSPPPSPGPVDRRVDGGVVPAYGAGARSPATGRCTAPRGRERDIGTELGIWRSWARWWARSWAGSWARTTLRGHGRGLASGHGCPPRTRAGLRSEPIDQERAGWATPTPPRSSTSIGR